MTLTQAIANLKAHYGHRFVLDLSVTVPQNGSPSVEWSAFDPIHGERHEADGLEALVAMVVNRADTIADLDAAGVAEVTA